ncbi:MAG TPA: flagellar motor protein MotB [Bryobacteraceae bacterium]|nr:flagellar motor protein MotB [Bryobacteraceae bacterium]
MARRKHDAGHENHERWLVSYADFITLLFAFFVVMFATSQTDKNKAQAVQDSVQKALEEGKLSAVVNAILGGSPVDKKKAGNAQLHGSTKPPKEQKADYAAGPGKVAELLPSLALLTKELEEEIRAGKITVSMERRGLVISFRQAALFPSGAATLVPSALPPLDKIAKVLLKIPNPVRLEGHTDSVPIHNSQFQSNWELSAARSITLLRVLTEECRVPDARLSIAGYGDNDPADSNDTEEGRARNRRVDIVVLNETGLAAEPQRGPPTAAISKPHP